jgi:dihydrofolate synthase/folylpolyglutamate synthase
MEQVPEALEVFEKAVIPKQSPLLYFPHIAALDALHFDQTGTSFTLSFNQPGIFPEPLDLKIPIPGEIQAKNAGLAVLAVKTAFPEITGEAVRRGLSTFTLPARFERIRDNPRVIIDGAHTPYSIRYCTETFTALYGSGGILLFGCAARKDALAMAKTLILQFSRIIITTPGNFKTSYPEQVYELFQNLIQSSFPQSSGKESPREPGVPEAGPPELFFIKDTAAAIAETLRIAEETGLPVLGTGSFYLAAEIRTRVKA